MDNIIAYLRWRGDLPFSVAPFNEVDNLVLSMCSFLELEGFVPDAQCARRPTLQEAVEWFDDTTNGCTRFGLIIPPEDLELVRLAAQTNRFGDILIGGYRNHIDKELVTQFSATTYLLPDETIFIAYRGTDDTIVGWKENMNLCLEDPVPAELEAVSYLGDTAAAYGGFIRLGGHSKGGHLAIRAAADVTPVVQERLIQVYSNDGPGFLPSFFETPGYLRIRDRCTTFIPQSSIVGVLLEQDDSRCTLIHSTQAGVMQHDPVSWDVMCTSFQRLEQRSRFGRVTDEALKNWILGMEPSERKTLIDSLFSIFDAPDVDTLTELDRTKIRSGVDVVQALRGQSPETRKMVMQLYKRLFRPGNEKAGIRETSASV